MTASSATPDSRKRCSVSGTRASAKANRSRKATGAVWWLRPMTTKDIAKKYPIPNAQCQKVAPQVRRRADATRQGLGLRQAKTYRHHLWVAWSGTVNGRQQA